MKIIFGSSSNKCYIWFIILCFVPQNCFTYRKYNYFGQNYKSITNQQYGQQEFLVDNFNPFSLNINNVIETTTNFDLLKEKLIVKHKFNNINNQKYKDALSTRNHKNKTKIVKNKHLSPYIKSYVILPEKLQASPRARYIFEHLDIYANPQSHIWYNMPIAKEVKKHSNSSTLINSSTKLPTTINIRNISRIYFKKKPFSFDTGYRVKENRQTCVHTNIITSTAKGEYSDNFTSQIIHKILPTILKPSNNTLYPDLNNDATKDEQKLTNNLSNNNNQITNIRPLVTGKKLPKGKYFTARRKTLEMLKNRQLNIRKKPISTKKHKELEIPTIINQPDDNVYVANRLIYLKRFFERKRFSLNNTKKGHTSNKFAHPTSNRRIILPRRYNLL